MFFACPYPCAPKLWRYSMAFQCEKIVFQEKRQYSTGLMDVPEVDFVYEWGGDCRCRTIYTILYTKTQRATWYCRKFALMTILFTRSHLHCETTYTGSFSGVPLSHMSKYISAGYALLKFYQ